MSYQVKKKLFFGHFNSDGGVIANFSKEEKGMLPDRRLATLAAWPVVGTLLSCCVFTEPGCALDNLSINYMIFLHPC